MNKKEHNEGCHCCGTKENLGVKNLTTGEFLVDKQLDEKVFAMCTDHDREMYPRAGQITVKELLEKKPDAVKIYFPPWAGTHLAQDVSNGIKQYEKNLQKRKLKQAAYQAKLGMKIESLLATMFDKATDDSGFPLEEYGSGEFMFVVVNPDGVDIRNFVTEEGKKMEIIGGYLANEPYKATLYVHWKPGSPVPLAVSNIVEIRKDGKTI